MTARIGRRDFITLLGGAAATPMFWPRVARAQQPAMPVVGFLTGSSNPRFLDLFLRGLGEAGYVEGKNLKLQYESGPSYNLATIAGNLVRRQPNVIIAGGLRAAIAAKAATQSIPIVFQVGNDPVEIGLVKSLNRPGGNLTGISNLNVELGPKRLELLHELAPAATVMALLVNPTNPVSTPLAREALAAARAFGIELHVLEANAERDFDSVFATLRRLQVRGLVIGTDPFLMSRSEQLATLAFRQALPTVSQFREFAAAGGLMSYGGDSAEVYRTVGLYAARILKGEKPADLPVQQSTKVELIINLKTAKALGLTVPITLLGRADEVIE